MRVVHLINGLGAGGGERLVAELACRLPPEYQTTIYCLTRTGAVAEELRGRGVAVHRLSWEGIPSPLGWARFARDLGRADILHTHFFYSDLLGSVIGRVLGVRRMSTRHELGGWMRRPHRWLEPRVYRGAHRVVCVSRAVRDSLIERGLPAGKMVVVSSGIEMPPATGEPRQRVVISVGRLEPVKGHDVLVRAFAATPELAGWRLLLVGDGSERECLEASAARLGIAGRCQLVGAQPPERVRELLSTASLFVLPSRSEALGLALLEAMAAGCACIASAVGGVPEVVTHDRDGWLVEEGAPEALSAALARLAADEGLRARLATAGRARVEAAFTVDRYVAEVAELYRQSTVEPKMTSSNAPAP